MLDDIDMPVTTPRFACRDADQRELQGRKASVRSTTHGHGLRPRGHGAEQEQEREGGFSVGTSHAQALACV